MTVEELRHTHGTLFVLCFREISTVLYPEPCTTLSGMTVARVAGKPYPRGRGEIGFESTSGSLRIRGCLYG